MKHIIHLEADSYPDLRDQIRQLVVDHGLVMVTEGGDTKLSPIEVVTTTGKSEDKKAADEAKAKTAAAADAKLAEKAKQEAEAKAKAAAEAEKVSDTKPEKKADKTAVKVDLDKCRTQVMAYVKENGQTKGKELIESFGATKISDVPEDKLEDLFVAAGGEL